MEFPHSSFFFLQLLLLSQLLQLLQLFSSFFSSFSAFLPSATSRSSSPSFQPLPSQTPYGNNGEKGSGHSTVSRPQWFGQSPIHHCSSIRFNPMIVFQFNTPSDPTRGSLSKAVVWVAYFPFRPLSKAHPATSHFSHSPRFKPS